MIGSLLTDEGGAGALRRFTRDLTAEARAGRLEPVRCRDPEIARVIDILLRHGKNNPALVGPSGVGKTAIAEGLAQRIVLGDVPVTLRSMRVLSLDHVGLLAGTTWRGQYEERIRSLVAETTQAADVILFIDELHNLIGQGTALGAAMDAANMLKPALVRGDFRVIGATTGDEYERWIEGDPALDRRFQKVVVRELGDQETLEILGARKTRLERHHNVLISDEALRAAVRLTDLHVLDRMRPDKAIDALDEACAHLQAVTKYSARAESLIRGRLASLRKREANETAQRAEPRGRAAAGNGDGLEQFAQDGLSALERFGAELEAMLIGDPAPVRGPEPVSTTAAAPPPEPASELEPLEAELVAVLADEGVVVTGADIARVVALTSGSSVEWSSEE